MKRFKLCFFLLFCFSTTVTAQQTLYVDASSTAQSPNGSLEAPFPNLNDAVALASAGDSIFVAGGLYQESIHLDDNTGMILMGGFAPGSFAERNPALYPTTIQGDDTQAVIRIEYFGWADNPQRYHIDGFIIEHGQRGILAQNYLSGGWPELVISNNIIRENGGLTGSNDYGGGVASASMLLELRNNHIHHNTCGKSAGFSVQLNSADHQVIIENNLVEFNDIFSDHGAGAGVQIYRGIIRNNIFRNNRILESWGWGGGLIVDGNRFSGFSDDIYILLSGNEYSHNTAPSGGGGLFIDEGANVRMFNELIVHNESLSSRNGGLLVDGPRGTTQARTEISGITIAHNTGADWNQGHAIHVEDNSEVRIRNGIFWENTSTDNSVDFFVDDTSSLHIHYSIFQIGHAGNGDFQTFNSFTDDPLFGDAEAGNFYLKSTAGRWNPTSETWVTDDVSSPAIDAGDPDSPFDNEPTPNGDRVNLGAFGNTPYASMSSSSTGIPFVGIPESIQMIDAYPNPFNPTTNIRFYLDTAQEVRLEVYDVSGRWVQSLKTGFLNQGNHQLAFDASHLPSGAYFILLQTQTKRYATKVMLVK